MSAHVVDELKDTIRRLEAKISHIEAKLEGRDEQHSNDGLRMVLIGPPGAGQIMCLLMQCDLCSPKNRQRYTGASYQGQVLRLPFGMMNICTRLPTSID